MCDLCESLEAIQALEGPSGVRAVMVVEFGDAKCPTGCGYVFKVGLKSDGAPPRQGNYLYCPNCVTLLRLGKPGANGAPGELLITAGVPDDLPPNVKERFKATESLLLVAKQRRESEAAAARKAMS